MRSRKSTKKTSVRDRITEEDDIFQTQSSIYASHREFLNISFFIQILIILYGILSFIDFIINIFPIYGRITRIIGILLFLIQLLINYHIWRWCVPHFDSNLLIPHKTNFIAFIMLHFIMPIVVCRWPELLFHRITSYFRTTYPTLIFWGAARCGTTTFAHYLRTLNYKNISFKGPLSPVTVPVTYNKESVYFIGAYGAYSNYKNYSILYPMNCSMTKNTIYFDGYPEYHCFPFIRDRLYDINPNMKFIFFVRDPCNKVISHWCQLKYTYLQMIGKDITYWNNNDLDKLFRNSLDMIKSEKYKNIYNYFLSININKTPHNLKENISDWFAEMILGRAMFGRDLKFWFKKFNNKNNWLILDMMTVLKNKQSIKNAVLKICQFVDIKLDDKFIKNWIPKQIKLNQNNIKYTPPDQYMNELKAFYEMDQKELFQFIKEKELNFICDSLNVFR